VQRTLHLIIRGKTSYEKWTIHQWILSFKSLLEEKYCTNLDIKVEESEEDYPVILIDGFTISNPPFEEGYLLEMLDSYLHRVLERCGDE